MKKNLIAGGISLILFAALGLMLKSVDVAAIGPEGSSVGFAGLNGFVFETLGQNSVWKALTTVTGLLALLTAAVFAGIGAWQLYTRRSLMKVDRALLAMGAVYIILLLVYIVYDKVPVNFRPVLEDGQLESSFPSSHAMLACTVFGCACVLVRRTVTRRITRDWLIRIFMALAVLTAAGRLLAGVHWCTDILGGVLIALGLTSLYSAFVIWDSSR